jgi:predicted nucleic-acid-binding Zn-ribbon protein
MSAFIKNLAKNADFMWDAVMENLPTSIKMSRTNFINFNCPMCISRGETPDTKKRCGIAKQLDLQGHDSIRVSCFNCGFKAVYSLGSPLSGKFRQFLSHLGLQELEINKLNHRAFTMARIIADSGDETILASLNRYVARFDAVSLPPDTKPLSEWINKTDNPNFSKALKYALSRGEMVYNYAHWTPNPKWQDRIIFPAYWYENIVGWTGRLIEDNPAVPKYLNEVPANYLANCNVMQSRRKYLLMPEGYLDALAIDGISPLGAKLNSNQTTWIKETNKEVIVIPDRDKSGQRLIDIAIENEWKVAFPRLTRGGNNWWEEDCKDCAEAVKRYGRLYTLRSIIETSTNRRLEIETRRKWLY